MLGIVYFSNYSGNTKRFVEKLDRESFQIPIDDSQELLLEDGKYVLFAPTYGGGSVKSAIPRQVKKFLNVESNRKKIIGVVGFGNTNFGEHYCKAADLIADKLHILVLGRVEIFGTEEDVNKINERLAMLDDK